MPDLWPLRASPAMGDHVHGLWQQALALPGRRANGLRMRPVPQYESGQARGDQGRREEVGGVPPESPSPLILVPWARLLGRPHAIGSGPR